MTTQPTNELTWEMLEEQIAQGETKPPEAIDEEREDISKEITHIMQTIRMEGQSESSENIGTKLVNLENIDAPISKFNELLQEAAFTLQNIEH